MRRWLMLLLLVLPMSAQAQTEPQLSVDLPEGEVIIGKPLTLRIKLLVPTWMPKPPVWPTLEVPSLLVRLPERASTPISETINGETWSGISRAYRLYPLEIGGYEIPGQTLAVTYADPGKPDPIVARIPLDAIRFQAVLPKGATGLDPPIVASGLTLEQQIDGPQELETGGAVTRVVTISIKGTTPILLPSLMPELPANLPDPPLRAYPREPVVREVEQRGVLSGSKVEATTYVAQSGGMAELPAITVKWFNLESGKVETAHLGEVSLSITAPPPPPPGPADYARWGVIALVVLAVAVGLAWLVGPRLRRARTRIGNIWRGSRRFAHRRVMQALKARDLNETMAAFDLWAAFDRRSDPHLQARFLDALAQIGAAKYAINAKPDVSLLWRNARHCYFEVRKYDRAARKADESANALPPLNPST
jgi:hypothetical protein